MKWSQDEIEEARIRSKLAEMVDVNTFLSSLARIEELIKELATMREQLSGTPEEVCACLNNNYDNVKWNTSFGKKLVDVIEEGAKKMGEEAQE